MREWVRLPPPDLGGTMNKWEQRFWYILSIVIGLIATDRMAHILETTRSVRVFSDQASEDTQGKPARECPGEARH